jgi:flavin reductase (DIM6/NTAB) family NADH-FMN oxidoreductase RutF
LRIAASARFGIVDFAKSGKVCDMSVTLVATRTSAALERQPPPPTQAMFKDAMRHMPSGVCVVTFGKGDERTGMTANSVSSLSVEPPTMLVSVNRSSSSYAALARSRVFGVNVLASEHRDVANRFAGRDGERGAERYAGRRWFTLNSGVWLLSGAVAAFDCEVEEVIERHTHAIVIGRVNGLVVPGGPSALVYWRGDYDQLGWSHEEVSRAIGLTPIGV